MSKLSERATTAPEDQEASALGRITIVGTFVGVGICVGMNAALSTCWPPDGLAQRGLYAVLSAPWIFLGPFVATSGARRQVMRAMGRRTLFAGPWVLLAAMAMFHLRTARDEGDALRGFHDENRDALRGGLIPAIGAISADPVAQLPAMRMKLYALKAYLYEQDIIAEPGLTNPFHVLQWDVDAFIDGSNAVESHALLLSRTGSGSAPLYIPLDCGVRGCGDDGTSLMLGRLGLSVDGKAVQVALADAGREPAGSAWLIAERTGYGRENLRWLRVILPDGRPEVLVKWSVTEKTGAPLTVFSLDLWRFVRAAGVPADRVNVRLSFSQPLRGGATWGLHDLTSLWEAHTPLLRIDDATFRGALPGPGALAAIPCTEPGAAACFAGSWTDATVPPFLAFDQTLGESELEAQRESALEGLRQRVKEILSDQSARAVHPEVFLYCETCTGHDAIFRDLAGSPAPNPPDVRLLVGPETPNTVVADIFTEFRNSKTRVEVRRLAPDSPTPMKEFGIVAREPQEWAFVSVVVDPSTGVALLLQGEGAQDALERFERFWNEPNAVAVEDK